MILCCGGRLLDADHECSILVATPDTTTQLVMTGLKAQVTASELEAYVVVLTQVRQQVASASVSFFISLLLE